ncbi:MAG TPA: hypothetical protein GXX46_11195 [Peptococcaceae bacterium]|nr:hypothetical protein [Peptococcaceae bacterium]
MGLKIGLDIDGVVANSFPVFLRELNKHYGKNLAQIDNYKMTELFEVSQEDLSAFFDANVEYLYFAPEPMAGALATIESWFQAGHEIIFITARKLGIQEQVTRKWFKKYGLPDEKIIFAGGASKTFAVREYCLDVFVEDFTTNAFEIAAIGVPVLLLDAPYNQGKLPTGVTRCYNWEDIKCEVAKLACSKGLTAGTFKF